MSKPVNFLAFLFCVGLLPRYFSLDRANRSSQFRSSKAFDIRICLRDLILQAVDWTSSIEASLKKEEGATDRWWILSIRWGGLKNACLPLLCGGALAAAGTRAIDRLVFLTYRSSWCGWAEACVETQQRPQFGGEGDRQMMGSHFIESKFGFALRATTGKIKARASLPWR